MVTITKSVPTLHMPKQNNYNYYNFIILGDGGVGKTSIFERFCNNKAQIEKKKQKSLEIFQKILFKNNIQYRLKLWDTFFDQSFVKLNKPIYERANCIIIVFAVNDKASFTNITKWIEFLEDNIDISTKQIVLFGNKIDLKEERKVTIEEIKKRAKDLEVDYYEISASKDIGINEAFDAIVDKIIIHKNKESGVKIDQDTYSSGKGCAK